jgi:hypothetical protein
LTGSLQHERAATVSYQEEEIHHAASTARNVAAVVKQALVHTLACDSGVTLNPFEPALEIGWRKREL